MSPSNEIESFYRSFQDGLFLSDEFKNVAALCEEWFLIFTGQFESPGHAVSALQNQGDDYSRDRLVFACAMGLCAPSPTSVPWVEKYEYFRQPASPGGRVPINTQPNLPAGHR